MKVQNAHTAGPTGEPRFIGWCLDKQDLCVAKLCALREKDENFVDALITANSVDPHLIAMRLGTVPEQIGERRSEQPPGWHTESEGLIYTEPRSRTPQFGCGHCHGALKSFPRLDQERPLITEGATGRALAIADKSPTPFRRVDQELRARMVTVRIRRSPPGNVVPINDLFKEQVYRP